MAALNGVPSSPVDGAVQLDGVVGNEGLEGVSEGPVGEVPAISPGEQWVGEGNPFLILIFQ